MAQKLQTVIFSKNKSPSDVNSGNGWTHSAAASWLSEHDLKLSKTDETSGSFRFRQFDPSQCTEGSFKTLSENFPVGVAAVSCEAGEVT